MLSNKTFTHYQPQAFYNDGMSIIYGSLPKELYSFQAFPTREECEEWLKNNGYKPSDFNIFEYEGDSIEEVTLIDRNGDVIPRIEELEEDGLINLIGDEVLCNAGSMDNLKALKQDGETQQEYEDRIYTEALDHVNAAIMNIEKSGEYNFQSYSGTPDVDWYDDVRDWVVEDVMAWMTE